MKEDFEIPCNIAQSLNIIGDRWTLLIIHEILSGHHTFNEIKKPLKGLSANLLSARLRFLEQSGLIISELYSDHPPRYKYFLTESGKDLEHIFHSLILWGSKHLKKCYKRLLHTACQNEVEISYYCPQCNETVSDLRAVEV